MEDSISSAETDDAGNILIAVSLSFLPKEINDVKAITENKSEEKMIKGLKIGFFLMFITPEIESLLDIGFLCKVNQHTAFIMNLRC